MSQVQYLCNGKQLIEGHQKCFAGLPDYDMTERTNDPGRPRSFPSQTGLLEVWVQVVLVVLTHGGHALLKCGVV